MFTNVLFDRNNTAYGENKDYWDFIFESLNHSTNSPRFPRVSRAVISVVNLTHLETSVGKGRALIRWGLMYKMLSGRYIVLYYTTILHTTYYY